MILEGEFDARKESEDHISDANPVLSMSTLNHTTDFRPHEPNQTCWIYFSVDGLAVRVEFKSTFKSLRIEDGTFHSGYVRGGAGYDFRIVVTTKAGWHE